MTSNGFGRVGVTTHEALSGTMLNWTDVVAVANVSAAIAVMVKFDKDWVVIGVPTSLTLLFETMLDSDNPVPARVPPSLYVIVRPEVAVARKLMGEL
jgi:hypothetical protein